jgi:prolyl-tRNA editing enzyme YbaK/EbsC (Cys-tRNA(Pro) deacylase)
MTSAPPIQLDERLALWLAANGVEYELHPHRLTYTALATAHAEGVEPRTFAKVVAVGIPGERTVLVVLDAVDDVDLRKVSALVGTPMRLLTEHELAQAVPGWDAGTAPPVPELAGAQVFADEAVRSDERISFIAGSHTVAVRVDRAAWEQAAEITYGDVARRPEPTA